MFSIRKSQVSAWNTDIESSSSQRKKSDNDDVNQRRRSAALGLNTKCCCLLQMITGFIISALFATIIIVPIFVIQKQAENNHKSISATAPFVVTTSNTTTTTMVSTTTTTSTSTSTATTTMVSTTTTTSTFTSTATTTMVSTTRTTTSTSTSTATTTMVSMTRTTSTSTSTATTTTTDTTTTMTTTTTPGCYFGDDYVDLVHGGRRRIRNLKAGDRVWTLINDGKNFVEDEIMIIPHAGPNTLTYFYTFTTIEGHTIHLTDSHYIVVATINENKIKIICASDVTLEHQLIIFNRRIALEKIIYSRHIGFYSPITLSGYLTVNNISTSVYTDFLQVPHDMLHQIGGPFRIYYHITRWLFGYKYIPFSTTINDEIHPISAFIIDYYKQIQLFFPIFSL
ncbi:unnamed protein product [Adineta steineri]|uniref:Hint domain-containing protein n=2 Tax=Adineta steineri TaxID=433720 RepID=A0A818S2V3_9BILA|nr:unnamed protein product [Adineta steineri]CAF3749032.1 unnamed protein product [Adineta steineri]